MDTQGAPRSSWKCGRAAVGGVKLDLEGGPSWMLGRRTAHNEEVELAAVAAATGIHCLTSSS